MLMPQKQDIKILKNQIEKISNILISRTDSIGDVVLTLPLAGMLKQLIPEVKIGFLGRKYTAPIINACEFVDEFIDVDDFLKNHQEFLQKEYENLKHLIEKRK